MFCVILYSSKKITEIHPLLHPLLSKHRRDQTGEEQQLLPGGMRQLDNDESAAHLGGEFDRLARDEELDTLSHAHPEIRVAIIRLSNVFRDCNSDGVPIRQNIDRIPSPAVVYHGLSRMDANPIARIMRGGRTGSACDTEVQLADGPPQEVHNLPWSHAFEFGN